MGIVQNLPNHAEQPKTVAPLGVLQQALRDYLDTRGSMAKLAAEAGVSTRTIQALKAGRIVPANQNPSPRARKAMAESFTRLAPLLGLAPADAIRSYGLDPDSSAIREVVSGAGIRGQRNQIVGDDTIRAIRARGAMKNERTSTVNVLAMEWPPFFDSDSAETSFAYRYLSMMFGGVDSDWNLASLTGSASIRDATDKLLSSESDYDAIFGLYETTFRRSLGIAYVPVPGVSVPLDIVVVDNVPPTFDWRTVLDRQEYREYSAVHAVVIRDEAGAHVLAGLCRYPSKSITQSGGEMTNEQHYVHLAQAREKYGAACTVFFCADQFTCLDVERIAREKREFEVVRLNDVTSKTTDRAAAYPPTFPVGIAVRRKSDFFASLLNEVTTKEIFRFVVPRVARLYVDLFWEPESKNLTFDVAAIRTYLGEESWSSFQRACQTAKGIKSKETRRKPTNDGKERSFWKAIEQ
jgi:hypothetical protein